jgi:hypothetical protein
MNSPVYETILEEESLYDGYIAQQRKIILNTRDDLAAAVGLAWSVVVGGLLWGLGLAGAWLVGLL